MPTVAYVAKSLRQRATKNLLQFKLVIEKLQFENSCVNFNTEGSIDNFIIRDFRQNVNSYFKFDRHKYDY